MAKKTDLLTDCRVAVFECITTKEQRQVLQSVSEQCQVIANRFIQEWQAGHLHDDTRTQLVDWLAELKAWHETPKSERGAKPKCPVKFPPEGFKPDEIRKWASCQDDLTLKGRVAGLTLRRIEQTLRSRKAASGTLSGWMCILLNREAAPSFTRPLPVAFDVSNCRHPDQVGSCGVLAPTEGSRDWSLRVALTEGRNHYETIPLLTHKRKAAKQRIHLERIESGQYKFSGSQFFRDRSTGKWMVAICYQSQVKQRQNLDATKQATLSPGQYEPWILQLQDGVYWRGGRGDHVTNMRQRILRERQARSEHSRYCGTDRKGHGGKHGRAAFTKLSSKWKHFQKRYNNQVTTQLVDELVRRGIGSLVYLQPEDSKSATRFLASTGSSGGQKGLQGWEWFQVKTMLAQKCKRAGIEFSTRKM